MEAGHVLEYFVLPLWSSYTSTVKCLKENNGDEELNEDIGSKTNKEPVDQEDQAFLEELERLKQQAKEANEAAKTLRKTFAQCTEDLLRQVGAAKASSTNYVNTASTLVNTDSIIVTTSSPARNDSAAGPSNPNVDATHEELLQFKTQQVWILVDLPFGKKGHRQDEGIDYDEVFAPVARLEAIRIFLAFSSYMGFKVYQMDVKSAFLYGKIDEEVYVSQPPGFIDPKFAKKVYKVVKALYGLHQAPTVYVDDIIFVSTKKSCCDEFEALIKNRFQMSFMGKLTFFLGLQVKQREDGIFISQDKYVAKILKKFDFISVKTVSTTIVTNKPLVKDTKAVDVDVTPKTSHLQAVKRIFRYLKGQLKLGLWYPKESAFDLEAYSDSDYVGANLDRKSIIGGLFFPNMRSLGKEHVSKQGEDKKAKTRLNIKEGNFNKLDDLVGEGVDYVVNKERSTNKIKVLNAKEEGVSASGKTLSTATLAVSIVGV
nr:hypothetical protein [Tanacetum cinerariifolium]